MSEMFLGTGGDRSVQTASLSFSHESVDENGWF